MSTTLEVALICFAAIVLSAPIGLLLGHWLNKLFRAPKLPPCPVPEPVTPLPADALYDQFSRSQKATYQLAKKVTESHARA